MKHLYWIGVVVVIVGGIFIARSINIGPETQTLIPFSQVSTPEEMGQNIFKTLKAEVMHAPFLMLGVTPNAIEDIELWRGFLEAAESAGLKYEMIVVEPKLPYVEIFRSALYIDIKTEMRRFAEGLVAAKDKGLRAIVIVPTIYSSQLLKSNPVDRLQRDFSLPFLSLSATPFPVTKEQELSFDPKCVRGEGVDPEGTSALGCVIASLARATYRKKFEANKLSTQLEKVGTNDYLVLLNRNPSSQ
jgi:hypothetical protein